MTAELQSLTAKVDQVLLRLDHLENLLEPSHPSWKYLVSRPHSWRKQLCLKGRNITVGQLVGVMRANQVTPEQASHDFDLPLEAIVEALQYDKENRPLIDLEIREERRRIVERGFSLEPTNLPR